MQQHLLAKHARAIQKGDIYLQPSSQDMKKKIQTLRSEEHKGMKTESQHGSTNMSGCQEAGPFLRRIVGIKKQKELTVLE